MKIIKILIFMAAVFIVVVVVNYAIQYFNKGDKGDVIPWEQLDFEVQAFRADYEKEWDNAPKWLPQQYDDHINTLKELRSRNKLTEANYNLICRNVAGGALNRMKHLLEADYHKSEMPESTVEHNLEGVTKVSETLKDHPDAIKLTEAYGTYKQIKTFVNKDYRNGAAFKNGLSSDGTSWTPFSKHRDAEIRQKDKYLSDKYYTEYFTTNLLLSDGLKNLPSKVDACKGGYYNIILGQIEEKYKSVPRFDGSQYRSKYYDCTTDEERAKVQKEYDDAWDAFKNRYDVKRRNVTSIANKLKGEYSSDSFNTRIETLKKKYPNITKPAL